MDYSDYEEELSESDSDQDDKKRDPDFPFKKKISSIKSSNRKMVPSRASKLKGKIKPQNFIVYSVACVGIVKQEVIPQGTSLVVDTCSKDVENTSSVLSKNDECANNEKETKFQPKVEKLDPLDLNATVKVEDQMDNFIKLEESSLGYRESKTDMANHTYIDVLAKYKKEKPTPVYNNQGHHGNRKLKCKLCGKEFTRPNAFRDHKYQHTGQRPYECKTCHKTFYAKRYLLVHERCHSLRRYKCDVCDFTSVHKSCVRDHKLALHEKVKSKQCDVCGMSFVTSSSLKSHYRIHTGEKPYKCDVCGAGFRKSCYLRNHSLKHTGEKKCVCDICGKQLSTTKSLKQHKIIHTTDKPYKCNLCEASFTQLYARNRHYVTHSKEKPYQCDICLMKFTQKCSVSRHKKVAH